jgi:hypothetical protein
VIDQPVKVSFQRGGGSATRATSLEATCSANANGGVVTPTDGEEKEMRRKIRRVVQRGSEDGRRRDVGSIDGIHKHRKTQVAMKIFY